MEIYLQTGWLNFLFHFLFSMKSVCMHRIIEIYSGRRNDRKKNPKAVYFVVIVTTDSSFFVL